MNTKPISSASNLRIGIIGGGIAGSTIALKLANAGLTVQLFEQGVSLVNGPPICHLHAGGNLYREIDQAQCITLLRQSIDTLKLYRHSADYRPTVIAIPKRDPGNVHELLPRLERLQHEYAQLVAQCESNKVLGEPEEYFALYTRQQLERLATLPNPKTPEIKDDWLIPVAKSLDLDKLKFPLIVVQEYGLSVFRLAATATLSLAALENCTVSTHSSVKKISKKDGHWQLTVDCQQQTKQFEFDYLINACGYQSGTIDDLVGDIPQRLVEFKAAYVAHWAQCDAIWPEVIFYGQRGTPNGMAQLTPYPDGYFQIHGMTQDITLFEGGLVKSDSNSAQPRLAAKFIDKLTKQWPPEIAEQRSQLAIDFMSNFVPSFSSADVAGKPLFGAQQIPGNNPHLRAADVCFSQDYYARCEIVKASSAIDAANAIIENIIQLTNVQLCNVNALNSLTQAISDNDISRLSSDFAAQRNYPISLAHRNTKN